MGILSSDKLIVGYDLGNEYSQISFAVSESEEPQTLSQVAGAQVYNIPTALYKRRGTNQWLYGREALKADSGEGVLVENLFSMALGREPVVIDGESFDPVALLALFFRRSQTYGADADLRYPEPGECGSADADGGGRSVKSGQDRCPKL